MRYVQGERLDAATRQPLPDRLRLFEKVCEAVGFAHSRGILHRDLKPANIMIGAFGEVLVLDWGLARLPTAAEPEGRRMGTEGYMAPEQARAEANLDHRADVYSLGCILRDLVQGDAPKPLRSIVAKAMAEAPAERYNDAVALSGDVLRYLDGLAVSAHRESAMEWVHRFYTRNRALLLMVAAYVVMRVAVFVWLRR